MSVSTTIHLQRCLQQLSENNVAARTELLFYAQKRLNNLANRMFRRFPSLHFREQAEDLLQEAMIRLWKSLDEVGPTTVAGFMGLAALQMRRALCDLARSYSRKNVEFNADIPSSSVNLRRVGRRFHAPVDDGRNAPDELACWSEFHAAVDQLSEPYRTVFDLVFYHELPQAEVATLMGISVRQVQRYWNLARLKLTRKMNGLWPEV